MVDKADTEIWTLDDGEKITLRHITDGDANIEQKFIRKLSVESRYQRFHGSIKERNKKELETFTNPDPLNEEALIILHKGEIKEEEIGVARFIIDSDGKSCEFAIFIADVWQDRGLGEKLMKALISHAQARRIKRIYGPVLKTRVCSSSSKGWVLKKLPTLTILRLCWFQNILGISHNNIGHLSNQFKKNNHGKFTLHRSSNFNYCLGNRIFCFSCRLVYTFTACYCNYRNSC